DACSIVIVVSTSGPRLQSTLFPTRRSSDLPRLSLDVNHDCRLDLYIPVRALVGEGDRRWLAAGSRIRAPHVLGRKVTVIRIRCNRRERIVGHVFGRTRGELQVQLERNAVSSVHEDLLAGSAIRLAIDVGRLSVSVLRGGVIM